MCRSFRLKLGLLSVVLSGLVLLGLSRFAMSVLERVGIERIDRELRALAEAQVRKIQPPGHWRRFDESLRAMYDQGGAKQFLVKATHANGEPLYASSGWPERFSRDLPQLPPADGDAASPEAPSPPGRRRGPGEDPAPRLEMRGPAYATLSGVDGDWRAMTVGNTDILLSLAINLSDLRAEIHRFRQAILLAAPLVLLALLGGGWLIGHAALRPVQRIAATVASMTPQRLDERISADKVDVEFRNLIDLINRMLERLENGFRQATRFSADAAHELKTPLAILQAQAEQCLQRVPDGSPEQHEYASQLEEIQRLRTILRKLLLLSQADAGRLPIAVEYFDFAEVVRAAADDVRMLDPGRNLILDIPETVTVSGDRDLVRQAVDNLVSNAIKFGEPAGLIRLELSIAPDRAVLSVTNTGTPIPDEDRGRIFERFFRADKSRSRTVEGTGLGLSLAREIARAHGGDLVLGARSGDQNTFILTLPTAAGPHQMR